MIFMYTFIMYEQLRIYNKNNMKLYYIYAKSSRQFMSKVYFFCINHLYIQNKVMFLYMLFVLENAKDEVVHKFNVSI